MNELHKRAAKLSPEKRAILQRMLQKRAAASADIQSVQPRGDDGPAPLSYAQERLWLLDRLDPGSIAYNLVGGVRFTGALDEAALERSLADIVGRHEVLRSTFELRGGTPVQVISPSRPSTLLGRSDLTAVGAGAREGELERLSARLARTGFELARGPLLRLMLVRLGEGEHALIYAMHHIVSDAWSMGVFVRELTAGYRFYSSGEGAPLAALKVQYADYAVWQREWLDGEVLERQTDYWRDLLMKDGGLPVLELPTDRPRPAVQTPVGANRRGWLPGALQQRLERVARGADATLFMVLLAAFQTVLGRWTGQRRVVVGSPVANRGRSEIEPLIGFFVNTLVLPSDLSGRQTFKELLAQIRETTLGAYSHQDLPFEKLVAELQPERDLSHTPLFQVMLVMQNQPQETLELSGVELSPLRVETGAATFDLVLGALAAPDGQVLSADYRSDLFDGTTIQRLLGRLLAFLRGAADRPEARLDRLPLMPDAERHQLLEEWNDRGSDFGRPQTLTEDTLHGLFEAVALRYPSRLALMLEGHQLSYRELDRQAEHLARGLRARGFGPEAVVAIALGRSMEMMISILGVLKAGGAYLPLDPAAPRERLAWMLRDAGAALVLTRREEASALGDLPVPKLVLDALATPDGDPEPEAMPPAPVRADNPAYVIYTSGSTGRPKGVVISHRGAVNTLLWRLEDFDLEPDDAIFQNIAFTFDPSIWQIFGALLSGARLVLARPGGEQDFTYFVRRLVAERVTITDLAPSMLQVLLEHRDIGQVRLLRLLFAGGEALPVALERRFLSTLDADLRNIYGPTEGSIDAACWRCLPGDVAATVPIGRPVANKRLRVLDRQGMAVPAGTPGELWIGGVGLARGYLGRPGLTAERFMAHPLSRRPGARLYRTGDQVRFRTDGALEFLGRVDRQVKVRGFRIELGEVEAALGHHPEIREAAVVAAGGSRVGNHLVAYVSAEQVAPETREVKDFLGERLPGYMVPAVFEWLDALPRTVSGKVDYQALPEPKEPAAEARAAYLEPRSELEQTIAATWREVLEIERVGLDDNFFDLGGHSLLLVQVHGRLEQALERDLPVVDLFNYPTVRSLARHLDPAAADVTLERVRERALDQLAVRAGDGALPDAVEPVAIVGMVGRFPGSASVEELWQNLTAGELGISHFSDEELLAEGVPRARLDDPEYVRAGGRLDDVELFDAGFFDIPAREAEVLDPQQRLFLETAWAALEEAGVDPSRYDGSIGVYAGVSANTYLLQHLLPNQRFLASVGSDAANLGSDKDYLATRVSYKLNLRGPSLTVQTACSTSLVAVHLAVQALINRQCDMALAGGSSVSLPQAQGYLYRQGGIASPDGHCRPFDAAAQGTVGGNGVGVVVLKRLSRALADGDPIRAVIRATAINNDGSGKVGYTAPSVDGQAEVIASAQALAGVTPGEIGYIEAHGTGTPLGDPIEVAALTKVFGPGEEGQTCALGALKSNVGHLDVAAGVAGLIKASLVVERGQVPPTLHFDAPNPAIDFEATPFVVSSELSDWPRQDDAPRLAGVSSFGIGGTNAHAVIEEPPVREPSGPSAPWQLLPLSARSPEALEEATKRLAGHLEAHPEANLADVAYTLTVGRRAFQHRRIAVARDAADAAAVLSGADPRRLHSASVDGEGGELRLVFLFPGQGAQYPGMGRGLYDSHEVFRRTIDDAAEILEPHLGLDLRTVLYPSPADAARAGERLAETSLTQPALFVIEVALARLWQSWGVRPSATVGHSIGEYVAACLAGVMSFEDALPLVAARGRLMQGLPAGAMVAVPMTAEAVEERLPSELALAAINGPERSVVSGPIEAALAWVEKMAGEGINCRRLVTSHAFHSAMMDPILEDFEAEVRKVTLNPPERPFLSNLTGTWIEPSRATDPSYWVEHLRGTVRFADNVTEVLENPDCLLLEVGPGRTLGDLARGQAKQLEASPEILTSLPHPTSDEADEAVLRFALGRLWLAGAAIDGPAVFAGEKRRRVILPTYPFQRRRYWVEADTSAGPKALTRAEKLEDWLYAPVWREAQPPTSGPEDDRGWLIFEDGLGIGEALADQLRQRGQRVATARAGESFAPAEGAGFTLDPRRREDYERLLRALAERGMALPRLVHLWTVTGETSRSPEELLDSSFYSLLFLAQALIATGAVDRGGGSGSDGDRIELTVISDGLFGITGDETLAPVKATLLGPVRVMPLELGGARCRSIDVSVPASDSQRQGLIEQLEAELLSEAREPSVAWRGQRRWVPAYEALPALPEPEPSLEGEGAYLVTGGLGGLGLALARALVESSPGPVILVGRSGLPPRETWDEPGDEDQRQRIDGVRALEALGVEVVIERADVADLERLSQVVAAARERFGGIRGVVHAAGVAGGGLIELRKKQDCDAVFEPKVHGTLALHAALADEPLEFFVVCSSLASLLGGVGQVDYAAANAFLDAFAWSRAGWRRAQVMAIDWDAWREAGMAARAHRDDKEPRLDGLATSEGVRVFRRVLADRRPQTVVSTLDLETLIERFRQPVQQAVAEPLPAHERPDLTTAYAAPRNPTEEQLAGILQEVLGVEQVGIHDDFAELGGDSLLAIQVLARIRESLGVELALRDLFETPTVAELALRLLEAEGEVAESEDLEALLADLDGMSEEEALASLAADELSAPSRVEEDA